MSELISGKEALKAIADGIAVLFRYKDGEIWTQICSFSEYSLVEFLNDEYYFKLKPRTIKINGIEVPAPFEPKEGDKVYFIDLTCINDYEFRNYEKLRDSTINMFWRTEVEIKQVVAALRSVFNERD